MRSTVTTSPTPTKAPLTSATVFLAFGAFGLLWGLYAAALPVIKTHTGASDGALGTALVAVGLAAAPAMFAVGRLLDRYGRRVAVTALCLFAVVAPLPTLANSVPMLVVTLLLFGAGSGACDVVINSLAATVEADTGARVLNRAHALFSTGLLAGTVITSLTRTIGVSVTWPLVVLAAATVVSALALRTRIPTRLARSKDEAPPDAKPVKALSLLVIGFGTIAALASLVESGIQQWSAVFLQDAVHSPAGLASLAPGIFAGSMALGRLAAHSLSTRVTDRIILLIAGIVSALGALIIATAHHPATALIGFAVAGAAISVAAPTIYSLAGRNADPSQRGAVIGTTASIAYIGLLLGPAVVGLIAGQTQLRTAMASLIVVALAVSVAALLTPGKKPERQVEHS